MLRNNIKIYQTTIDSLNRENRQLKAEKNDALSRYQKATREADQLQKDNYELNEKVNLAAPTRSDKYRNTHVEQTR